MVGRFFVSWPISWRLASRSPPDAAARPKRRVGSFFMMHSLEVLVVRVALTMRVSLRPVGFPSTPGLRRPVLDHRGHRDRKERWEARRHPPAARVPGHEGLKE